MTGFRCLLAALLLLLGLCAHAQRVDFHTELPEQVRTRAVPLGFTPEQFDRAARQAVERANAIIRAENAARATRGLPPLPEDARFSVGGSSVNGFSREGGTRFGPTSDIDLQIRSDSLVEVAKSRDPKLGPDRHGNLTPDQTKRIFGPELGPTAEGISTDITRRGDPKRPVSFKVFSHEGWQKAPTGPARVDWGSGGPPKLEVRPGYTREPNTRKLADLTRRYNERIGWTEYSAADPRMGPRGEAPLTMQGRGGAQPFEIPVHPETGIREALTDGEAARIRTVVEQRAQELFDRALAYEERMVRNPAVKQKHINSRINHALDVSVRLVELGSLIEHFHGTAGQPLHIGAVEAELRAIQENSGRYGDTNKVNLREAIEVTEEAWRRVRTPRRPPPEERRSEEQRERKPPSRKGLDAMNRFRGLLRHLVDKGVRLLPGQGGRPQLEGPTTSRIEAEARRNGGLLGQGSEGGTQRKPAVHTTPHAQPQAPLSQRLKTHAAGYAKFAGVLVAFHGVQLLVKVERGEMTRAEMLEQLRALVLSKEAIGGYFAFVGIERGVERLLPQLRSAATASPRAIVSAARTAFPGISRVGMALTTARSVSRIILRQSAVMIVVMAAVEISIEFVHELEKRPWEEGRSDLRNMGALASFATALVDDPMSTVGHLFDTLGEAVRKVDWLEVAVTSAAFVAGATLASLVPVLGQSGVFNMLVGMVFAELARNFLVPVFRGWKNRWQRASAARECMSVVNEMKRGTYQEIDTTSTYAGGYYGGGVQTRTVPTNANRAQRRSDECIEELPRALQTESGESKAEHEETMQRLSDLSIGRLDTSATADLEHSFLWVRRNRAQQAAALDDFADDIAADAGSAAEDYQEVLERQIESIEGAMGGLPGFSSYSKELSRHLDAHPDPDDPAGNPEEYATRFAGGLVDRIGFGGENFRKFHGSRVTRFLVYTLTSLTLDWHEVASSEEEIQVARRTTDEFLFNYQRTRRRELGEAIQGLNPHRLKAELARLGGFGRSLDVVTAVVGKTAQWTVPGMGLAHATAQGEYFEDSVYELNRHVEQTPDPGGWTLPSPPRDEDAVRRDVRRLAYLLREQRALEGLNRRLRSRLRGKVPARQDVRLVLRSDEKDRAFASALGSYQSAENTLRSSWGEYVRFVQGAAELLQEAAAAGRETPLLRPPGVGQVLGQESGLSTPVIVLDPKAEPDPDQERFGGALGTYQGFGNPWMHPFLPTRQPREGERQYQQRAQQALAELHPHQAVIALYVWVKMNEPQVLDPFVDAAFQNSGALAHQPWDVYRELPWELREVMVANMIPGTSNPFSLGWDSRLNAFRYPPWMRDPRCTELSCERPLLQFGGPDGSVRYESNIDRRRPAGYRDPWFYRARFVWWGISRSIDTINTYESRYRTYGDQVARTYLDTQAEIQEPLPDGR